ncbi:MAG: hypothetical protein WCE53_08875 [Candidatus Acidiferrum sp.]
MPTRRNGRASIAARFAVKSLGSENGERQTRKSIRPFSPNDAASIIGIAIKLTPRENRNESINQRDFTPSIARDIGAILRKGAISLELRERSGLANPATSVFKIGGLCLCASTSAAHTVEQNSPRRIEASTTEPHLCAEEQTRSQTLSRRASAATSENIP